MVTPELPQTSSLRPSREPASKVVPGRLDRTANCRHFALMTPSARPSQPLRLHGSISREIGIAIVRGDYRPGDTLPSEDEFSERLGVSRTAYREAIRMLAAKGLVTSRTRTGTRVEDRSRWSLFDPDVLAWHFEVAPRRDYIQSLYEFRTMIEPAAAALAARRRTQDDLAAMVAPLQIMRAESFASDRGQRADMDFHHAILTAAGNEPLLSLAAGIGAAIRWSTIFKERKDLLRRDAIPDHERVYEAIAAKDEARARQAMTDLLEASLSDARIGEL
jgi:DNA-binding FadR family transcriptional regulator